MILSRTTRYGLRAAALLAERSAEDRPATVAEIAEALEIPRNYLSKTLHALARQGVLVSERGPSGGFRLAKPPEKLKLSAIVEALEPGLGEPVCLLGRPICSDESPCSAHEHWRALTGALEHFLEETTLADLTRREPPPRRGATAAKRGGRGGSRKGPRRS